MFLGTFTPWNESSRELSLLGAKVPSGNFRSWELKFPVGTFAPRIENTGKRKVPEPFLLLVRLALRHFSALIPGQELCPKLNL